MDPFEGRMQFLDMLKRLQASQSSQLRTAQFAIRNKDLDEDLFSCVLEELSSTSFNAKINILYFLETLCDTARRTGCETYVSMVQRHIGQIVEQVAPVGLQGTANIAQTRHFLRKMTEKSFLTEEEFTILDKALAERETTSAYARKDEQSTSRQDITKEDILRRIEEDRERHKRLRESIWVIPTNDDNWEFSQAWENTSDLSEVDFEIMREEMAIFDECLNT